MNLKNTGKIEFQIGEGQDGKVRILFAGGELSEDHIRSLMPLSQDECGEVLDALFASLTREILIPLASPATNHETTQVLRGHLAALENLHELLLKRVPEACARVKEEDLSDGSEGDRDDPAGGEPADDADHGPE